MKLDILAFGAHPDDVELACSGTLFCHIQQGYTAGIVDLTQGELGSRGTAITRKAESDAANKILGINIRENLKLADGFFKKDTESVLKVIEQIRKYQPNIIFCNAIADRHTDHGKGGDLVAEAAFLSGLVKIETTVNEIPQTPWRPKAIYHYIQDRHLKPDIIFDISNNFDIKMKAILAYKTQFYNPNSNEPDTPISSKEFLDFLHARAIEFGRTIGVKYGEGFNVTRPIGSTNLINLL